MAIHHFSLIGSFEIQSCLNACASQHLSVLLQLRLLLLQAFLGFLPFELSLQPLVLLFDLEPLLLLQSLLSFDFSFLSCLLFSSGLCLGLLLPGLLLRLEPLHSLPLLFCDLVLSLLFLQLSLPFLVHLLLLQPAFLLFSLSLQFHLLFLPLLHSFLLHFLLLLLLLESFPLVLCCSLLLLILKLLFLVKYGLLFCMGPLLFRRPLRPALVDDRLAAWTEPFDVLAACATVCEHCRHWLVRKAVLLAVGLQARLDVERSWAVIATNQLSSILAMIAVISILNFL